MTQSLPNLKHILALLRTLFFSSLVLLFLYSLGCGIGYGYLHRIPTQSIVSNKKPESKPPSPLPEAGTPVPSTNGYTEVCQELVTFSGASHFSICWNIHNTVYLSAAHNFDELGEGKVGAHDAEQMTGRVAQARNVLFSKTFSRYSAIFLTAFGCNYIYYYYFFTSVGRYEFLPDIFFLF